MKNMTGLDLNTTTMFSTWGIPAQKVQELHPQKNFFLRFCSFLVERYPLMRELLIPIFFALGLIFWVLRGFKISKIFKILGYAHTLTGHISSFNHATIIILVPNES